MYLLVAAVSFAPGNIPLPTRFQYIDPLQIVAPTFSGLSALLAASTFAEAKKQRTSTMINPGRHPVGAGAVWSGVGTLASPAVWNK